MKKIILVSLLTLGFVPARCEEVQQQVQDINDTTLQQQEPKGGVAGAELIGIVLGGALIGGAGIVGGALAGEEIVGGGIGAGVGGVLGGLIGVVAGGLAGGGIGRYLSAY